MKKSKNHIVDKLKILTRTSELSLVRLREQRLLDPSYKSIHDENVAKINLFSYLIENTEKTNPENFNTFLEFIQNSPVHFKEEVYDQTIFNKYWTKYAALLKDTNMDDF